ncbi:MAG: hypothetical protein M1826_006553 [Phylliscum demangeonii]|nr:MAG: hypothetical protein M1826_006553 [Phylliscum demangeonii]
MNLYVPHGQSEDMSRELARPNTPTMFADIAYKKKSRPSHVLKPRVQKHAVLAKRATDEESADSQKDVNREKNAREGPIVYTPEEMTRFKEQYNTARRSLSDFRNKLQEAKNAGLDVSEDDVRELSRLKAVVSQQSSVVTKARLGRPVDRVFKLDVASLEHDPTIQKAAKLGVYSARQLAEYKRSRNDAEARFRGRKNELAKVAKVRKITAAEKEDLAFLKRAYNLANTMWDRARKGRPANQRVDRRKSIENLLENPKFDEIAQSSGYGLDELAKARRRWLDARNAARAFKKELADVETVRKVTRAERSQMQALVKVVSQQEKVFRRMSEGKPVDNIDFPKEDLTALLKDPNTQRIAHLHGYSEEEVARQKRELLNARYEYHAAQDLLSAIKKEHRALTPEEEDHLVKTDDAYQLQKTAWERMTKGERVDPAVQPSQKLGRLERDVTTLRPDAKFDKIAHPNPVPQTPEMIAEVAHPNPVTQTPEGTAEVAHPNPVAQTPEGTAEVAHPNPVAQTPEGPARVAHPNPVAYTPEQIAMFDQAHLDAFDELLKFQQKLSALRRSGGTMLRTHEVYLEMLQDVYNLQRAWWDKVRPDLSVHGFTHDGGSVTYTAQEIADYNRMFLDASDKLRAFEKQIAVAQHAGRSPSPDIKAQHRALTDDFNKKKTTWLRARGGMPIDRAAQQPPESTTARSPETRRPGGQEQASQASPGKEHPSTTHRPLQISGPRRLLAPYLSSASHVLQGLGRQWHAMPWTRNPANSHLKMIEPAELLRAEHVFP